MNKFDEWIESKMIEWGASSTIELYKLVEMGAVDFAADDMQYDYYSEEQRDRLNEKIQARYYWREVSVLPVLRWKQQFVRVMNELMPKYKLLYEMMDSGIDILQVQNDYSKGRDIYSAFPQTQLSGNSDYATNGTDRERENIIDGDVLAKLAEFRGYNDIDVEILDQLEPLFSHLVTMSYNGM